MEERLEEILKLAVKRKVSDIHLTIRNNELTIEFRVFDKLTKIKTKENDIKLIQYLQFKANLDMGNLVDPASGRFETIVNDKVLALRYSIIYSQGIVNGVLRILNYDFKLSVDNLSMIKKQTEYFKEINKFKYGLLLFSGSTSSGKTTTLYTILNYLDNKKIFTIEDPIEVYSTKLIQLQVNEKQGLTYDGGIKQLLRHDPDIIMIGEIRDREAANMAIRASLTGHLVVATIHSYNPIGVIYRLMELGISKQLLSDVLIGIVNQRLYKKYQKDERMAVYEICQRKDLLYFLENDKFPKEYHDIEYFEKKALKEKYIEIK